jgi:DNA-binding transcriptional MocR family regulator
MTDFSGSPFPWPAQAVALWADCAGRAARQADLWTVPAPRGDDVLREVLAGLLHRDPDQITIVASLRAAALTYARRFPEITVERPTYPGLLPVFSAARVRLLTWDEMTGPARAGGEQARSLLWLTSPCRNPDGATLSPAERSALQAKAASGARVVVNATYTWFSPDQALVPGADTVGSLHKLRGVGARIGWVASPHFFDEAVPELLGTTPSRVWQRAWGLFLRDGGMAMLADACLRPVTRAAEASGSRAGTGCGFPASTGRPR